KGWDLGNNVIKGMYFNATFCLSELCPPEEIQTQVNRCGVESIKSTNNLKFFGNTFPLSNRYHLVCKFLKDLAVPVRVCLGKVASSYHGFTESKMIGFGGMSRYYAYQFPK